MSDKEEHSCETNIIRDQPNEVDYFNSQAHDRIAQAIAEIITKNQGGITIGLSGDYGSGKSTIINLLEKKINKPNENIRFVKFDAWAHEGNYLRLVFLKKIIDELDLGKSWFHNEQLKKNVKRNIENGKIRKVVPENRDFLIGMSLLLLLIPTILKLIVDGLEKGLQLNIFNQDLVLNIPLCVGVILLIPFIFIMSKALNNDNEELFEFIVTRNYHKEEQEPSSVEYDEWFFDVLKDTLSEDRKLIIVIDNLDRLSNDKILTFLSTLQTFLQYVQNPDEDSKKFLQEKLWVIIPYNPGMFEDITNNKRLSEENPTRKRSLELEEKRIQIKFEVPKLLLSDWQSFFRENLNEALPNHKDSSEIANIIYISKFLLPVDRRLPRDIIQCVNQIGTLHRQWCGTYPLDHIGYYVLDQNRDNPRINKRNLLSFDPSFEPYISQLTGNNLTDNIIGLAFNTTPQNGQELLIKDILIRALKEGDYITVDNSIIKFNEASGSYIEIILSELFDESLSLEQVHNIWLALFKSNSIDKFYEQRKLVIYKIVQSLIKTTVGEERLDSNFGIYVKDLIKCYPHDKELIQFLLDKLNDYPSSDGGKPGNLATEIIQSAQAFTDISEQLAALELEDQQFYIPIHSTKEDLFIFFIELFGISEFSFIKYLAILPILDEETDFTELLTSDKFINKDFNKDYLGAYKILEIEQLEFNPVNLSASLSSYLVSALDVQELSEDKIININAILDAILYFSLNNKEILSSLASVLTPHKDERLIRIFEHNLEQNNYRKAAQWLYLFFLCHPNVLSFSSLKYNDSKGDYLQNFVQDANKNYQLIINELFSFFVEFDIDYSTWFSKINIKPENVYFFISLLNFFNQKDKPTLKININWFIKHWNTIKTLSEKTIHTLVNNLYSNYDIQNEIIKSGFDPLWSEFYSRLVDYVPNKDYLDFYKNFLQNLTEEQWLIHFENQDALLNLLYSLINQIDNNFVLNFKDSFIDAYAEFANRFATNSNLIIQSSEEKWSTVYRAINRNYYKRCRYKVLNKLEPLEGKFREDFFLFFGELLMNASALKERNSSINSFYIPIIEGGKESHIQWIEKAFSNFGRVIILGNAEDDISVFIDKLELSISNPDIPDSIKIRLSSILAIVKE